MLCIITAFFSQMYHPDTAAHIKDVCDKMPHSKNTTAAVIKQTTLIHIPGASSSLVKIISLLTSQAAITRKVSALEA
jgi:hypothetical protein